MIMQARFEVATLQYEKITLSLQAGIMPTQAALGEIAITQNQSAEKNPQTTVGLIEAYKTNLIPHLQQAEIRSIQIPLHLVGTNLPPRACFYALLTALFTLGRHNVVPRIELFVTDFTIQQLIQREMNLFTRLKAQGLLPSQIAAIVKSFTVLPPDLKRKNQFTGVYLREFVNITAALEAPSSKVTDHLYLTRVPSKEEARKFKATHPRLKAIVAVLEDFEVADKGFFKQNIQTTAGWADLQVEHLQIPVRDNTKNEVDFPLENLLSVLKRMKEIIDKDGQIIVHCRLGKSRSATVVMAYLKLYGDKKNGLEPGVSNEILKQYLKQKRPQVDIRETHFKVLDDLVLFSRFQLTQDQPKTINEYLQSFEGKHNIAQFNSVKQLKAYALEKNTPEVVNAANHYLGKLCGLASLAEFVEHTEINDSISKHRVAIQDEILRHLAAKFNVDYAELMRNVMRSGKR